MKNNIFKDQSGFTLAELLVVIAIIGVLLVVVMINFSHGNYSTDLRRAGNGLMQDFRKAQSFSISGNSVKYCDESSTEHKYYPCNTSDFCQDPDGSAGSCALSVPGGGYGIMIDSPENYVLFGDTYFKDDSNFAHNYFDNNTEDYQISNINFSLDGIYIKEYKLGSNISVVPNNITYRLDVLFDVPEGKAKFYQNFQEAVDAEGQIINNLQIIVASHYVDDICRKITINRITGQISENQSDCNL